MTSVGEGTWTTGEANPASSSSPRSEHLSHIAGDANGRIRVAIVEEHDIVRRGLIASLAEDESLELTSTGGEAPGDEGIDIAVVSGEAARRERYPCPIVVCSDDPEGPRSVAAGNNVAGVLHQGTLTGAQLRATVRAAATGLRVGSIAVANTLPEIEPRARRVLELMADGYSTREIAARMSYSERTIKKLIAGLQAHLQTRSRAQTVALAIRRGLI
jgi:DNA-binding NarL/FixJ family response regulator